MHEAFFDIDRPGLRNTLGCTVAVGLQPKSNQAELMEVIKCTVG